MISILTINLSMSLINYPPIINLIITVKNSRVWEHCINNKVDHFIINKLNKNKIFDFIANSKSDIILSSGFPYILPKYVIDNRPIIINSHPSFLPKYKGYHSIEDAISSGEKNIGVTLHFVDEGIDTGEIIYQEKISIKTLTKEKIYDKVFSELEPRVIN